MYSRLANRVPLTEFSDPFLFFFLNVNALPKRDNTVYMSAFSIIATNKSFMQILKAETSKYANKIKWKNIKVILMQGE